MPDIRIYRAHTLGLPRARAVAAQWAAEAEQKFGMTPTRIEGEFSDTIDFKRSGAQGTLIVAADHFELTLALGFLMSGFAPVIQAQIEKNLDELLAREGDSGASA
jgi:putative polyhydroxyalkanoate system protein